MKPLLPLQICVHVLFMFHLLDSSGGKMVEPTPDIQKEMAAEMDRVTKMYGFQAGANVQDLPPMKFEGKHSIASGSE